MAVAHTIQNIQALLEGELISFHKNVVITSLVTDSRRVFEPEGALFFALKRPGRDGHVYLKDAYSRGVRNFIVSSSEHIELNGSNIIKVSDTLAALQLLTASHRQQFNLPVIGITGSNGKTVVKEWLFHLLEEDFNIVRSPGSYNSQIGVPLSVWQMSDQHSLGIFEAGISTTGEMGKLAPIINCNIGILTNIGEAHSEGFRNREEKLKEKCRLFDHASVVICKHGLIDPQAGLIPASTKLFTWSFENSKAQLFIKGQDRKLSQTILHCRFEESDFSIELPFMDEASVENVLQCVCALLLLKVNPSEIIQRAKKLQPVRMRLEIRKALNHCTVVNDSYSADLASLNVALDFLAQQSKGRGRTVILSDFLQSGKEESVLYASIATLLHSYQVSRVIGIGDNIGMHLPTVLGSSIEQHYFNATGDFLKHFRFSAFNNEFILVKGARLFGFERIVKMLEQQVHQTVLEINLGALAHNLRRYRELIEPGTKVMAMVKALSYGSGGAEVAGTLQFHQADFLGVAYADEGIDLRKSGIGLPIMVMNPGTDSFDAIVEYDLQPEIYSFELLDAFISFIQQQGIKRYPVHVELETGMNRLGIAPKEMKKLADKLMRSDALKLVSVFSHLVASEDPSLDQFTKQQALTFTTASKELERLLGYSFLKHISNTAAIVRHPELQFDMVRPGIGLYGIETPGASPLQLQPVATLRSNISQIRELQSGESVSYGRKTIVNRKSLIATVRLGYADGYPRVLGNGNGYMLVKGKPAPVAGTVCMDMTMLDVTDIPGVKEGDEVIVFGKDLKVEELAKLAGTIPYEIMTGISQRVKRVFFEE